MTLEKMKGLSCYSEKIHFIKYKLSFTNEFCISISFVPYHYMTYNLSAAQNTH